MFQRCVETTLDMGNSSPNISLVPKKKEESSPSCKLCGCKAYIRENPKGK